jgi:hypothetical protein
MEQVINKVFEMLRAFVRASEIKTNRGFTDFLADRITQAATKSTLLGMVERFGDLLQVNIKYVGGKVITEFLQVANKPEAENLLDWIREFNSMTAMILTQKTDEEFMECLKILKDLESLKTRKDKGKIRYLPKFDVTLKVKCVSPLAHGADTKAGNATLFRRMQVLSDTNEILSLPFYSGNAVRGTLRDLLADHLLKSLGLYDEKRQMLCKLWFFHTIFAGGCLEENSEQAKIFAKKLGAAGATKGEGIAELRKTLPMLSLLGTALGNRVIEGRINSCDLRPLCQEWGNGEKPVAELFEWTFLTRREDNESHADGENHSMIANTECLKAGTELIGGLDVRGRISDMEFDCLLFALELLKKKAVLGAESRRGMGKIELEYILTEQNGDPARYEKYILENKDNILSYLDSIGALVTSGEQDNIELEEKVKKTKKKKDTEEQSSEE